MNTCDLSSFEMKGSNLKTLKHLKTRSFENNS